MKRFFSVLIALITSMVWSTNVAHAATSLELSTPKSSLSVNKTFEITINITSDDNTLGTDVVLKYDPQILHLDSITPGTIYPNYSNLNGQTTTGTVSISAVSDFTSGVTPNGTYATLAFTPLAAGTTEISVAYDPNDTSLSGVIPFEGNIPNTLTQAPPPLNVTITATSLLNQVPSGTWRLPITIGAIATIAVVVFLLMRRKKITPPTAEPTGPTPAPTPAITSTAPPPSPQAAPIQPTTPTPTQTPA